MENHLVERIFNKLDEIQQSVAELDKKMAVHDTENKSAFKLIQEQQDEANGILDYHIKRTDLAESRIDALEVPAKFKHQLGKWILSGITFLTASAGLGYALFELFGKK